MRKPGIQPRLGNSGTKDPASGFNEVLTTYYGQPRISCSRKTT